MSRKRPQDCNYRSGRIHHWMQNPVITQKRQIFSNTRKKTKPEAMHSVWKCRQFSQCVIINPEAAILGISSPVNKVLALQISNIAAWNGQLSPSLRLYNSRKGFGVSQSAKSNYKSGSKLQNITKREKRWLWLASYKPASPRQKPSQISNLFNTFQNVSDVTSLIQPLAFPHLVKPSCSTVKVNLKCFLSV